MQKDCRFNLHPKGFVWYQGLAGEHTCISAIIAQSLNL